MTNHKTMQFEVDEPAAEVVREIFELYKNGWGYKKIANHLTDKKIPTPRMCEKMRKEAQGEEYKKEVKSAWSIITVSEILQNDFYIGTLRQGKYKRKKINGGEEKVHETDHIVFENNHTPIVDYRTFAAVQEQLKKRSTTNYRGVKKNDNVYSGYLFCGDCGSPMFAMSRNDLAPAYTCGTYHRRGTKGCTSHHTRVDMLDKLLKEYIRRVRDNSADMIERLKDSIAKEKTETKNSKATIDIINEQIDSAKAEIKMLTRQQTRDLMKHPDRADILEETYSEMLDELTLRIEGLKNQAALAADKHNSVIKINRTAKTVLDIFDDIISKPSLAKSDLDFILEKIVVYTDRIDIFLKADIDALLKSGQLVSVGAAEEQSPNFNLDAKNISSLTEKFIFPVKNKGDKVLNVNVISNGDPLEIYTSNDGEVIFKKYSAISEMSENASQVAEIMCKLAGCPVVIFDRDHVVAVSGVSKKEFNERRVSPLLEELMERRRNYFASVSDTANGFFPAEGVDKAALACMPILSSGDVTGAVAFMESENSTSVSELQKSLISAAALFLGKQIEG